MTDKILRHKCSGRWEKGDETKCIYHKNGLCNVKKDFVVCGMWDKFKTEERGKN